MNLFICFVSCGYSRKVAAPALPHVKNILRPGIAFFRLQRSFKGVTVLHGKKMLIVILLATLRVWDAITCKETAFLSTNLISQSSIFLWWNGYTMTITMVSALIDVLCLLCVQLAVTACKAKSFICITRHTHASPYQYPWLRYAVFGYTRLPQIVGWTWQGVNTTSKLQKHSVKCTALHSKHFQQRKLPKQFDSSDK